MSEQRYRSIGATTGLCLGLVAMRLAGQWGLLSAFCFGVGGTLLGGMIGERLYKGHRSE